MQDLTPQQQKKMDTLKRVVDAGGEVKDAVLGDILAENLTEALKNVTIKASVDIPPFPSIPEQKAPIVNVEAPIVNVDTKEVAKSVTQLHETTKAIKDILSVKEEFEPVQVYDKNGKLVDWDKLTRQEGHANSGMFDLDLVNNTLGSKPLSGSSSNGTRDLTSANTWYSVPSTVPSSPYVLVATIESNSGTVRFGFDNTGTPSATVGNLAPAYLTVRLAANQVVYFASSTAGDDVNWTTKVI